MGFPICQFEASAKLMNMDWKLYPGNQRLPSKTTGNQKYVLIKIWRKMGRKIKVFILHVKILMYH